MDMKRILRRTAAFIMALIIAICACATVFADAQEDLAELNAQMKALEAEGKEIQKEIDKAKAEKNEKIANRNVIGNQINNTSAQIDTIKESIVIQETLIENKERQLKAKEDEIAERYELFKKRFRAMSTNRSANTLGMVLGADDVSQFLTRSEITTRVAQYDNEIIEQLVAEKLEIEEIKKALDLDRQDLENDKAVLDEKRGELDSQYAKAQQEVLNIAALEQQFLEDKEASQKQMAEIQAQISQIYADLNLDTTSAYVGGELMWPCPNLSTIYSYFGTRFGGSDNHTGIDISGSGAYGKPVVAANTGTVVKVVIGTTGYGKFLIIDHGGGRSTLYAHCSEILVGEGQTVTQGQTIAKVGSTGWVTGPHLHFEVREGNSPKNPMSYLGK